MSFKYVTKVYFDPYCVSWSNFLAGFIEAQLFWYESFLPSKSEVLVVMEGVDCGETFGRSLPELNNVLYVDFVSGEEFKKRVGVNVCYDVVFFVDASKSCEYYLSQRKLLKRDGVLIVLFPPNKRTTAVKIELDHIRECGFPEVVLSRYHIPEFMWRKKMWCERYGAVLAAYAQKGSSRVWYHIPAGEYTENVENFVADWIDLCERTFNVKPHIKVESDGDTIIKETLSIVKPPHEKVDMESLQKQINELREKHKLDKKQLGLRVDLGLIEVEVYH